MPRKGVKSTNFREGDFPVADLSSAKGVGQRQTSKPMAFSNCKVTKEAKLLTSILNLHLSPDDEAVFAQDILDRLGSIGAVFRSPPMEIFTDETLGSAAVANIDFVRQLIFRETSAPLKTMPVLSNPDTLVNYLRLRAGRLEHEHLRVLLLDAKNRLIGDPVVANGGTTWVRADVRAVLCLATRSSATSIILVHNHPSGDPNPSVADIEMTSTIKEACDLTGIKLLDHVIIAGDRWYSFKYSGDL